MTLKELREHCYVPYSDSPSVAVVQSETGDWFPGVRVENISFPLTISAVQNALYCCISEGFTPEIVYTDQNDHGQAELNYWSAAFDIETADTHEADTFEPYDISRSQSEDSVPEQLRVLMKNAVVPHSDFPVAALLQNGGHFISGVNIETDDWGKGLCAERVALAKAITYGYREFEAIHISTRDGDYNSPCGACRQVIAEHLPHHSVYLYHADGTRASHFSSDLLPYSFLSSALQKNPNK